MKEHLEFIDKYSEQGISVFPCGINKAPAIKEGFYAATNDREKLKELFPENKLLLIGLPTGNTTGIVVVDVDLHKEGDPRDYEEIVGLLPGELPETYSVDTMNGGRHLYYRITSTKLSCSVRTFGKNIPVDIRANGGYVVAAGSRGYNIHDDSDDFGIDNLIDRLTPLPEWIENYRKESITATEENIIPESEVIEIRSALSYIPSDDRDLWIKIGLALRSTGSNTGKGLWVEWSQKSSKFNPMEIDKKWGTFNPNSVDIGTLFYEAKKYGWVSTYKNENPIVVGEVIEPELSTAELAQRFSKPKFPEHLLKVPGLIGEISEFIDQKSIKPQPIYALAGAIAAVGALAGRKYQ